ncbi:MAG: hypothetical protein LQ340_000339 [Diploschistes diacapsis]|nr:MAG: hypothetical protein LQ340_000339 [Diploschistes diacapsis]
MTGFIGIIASALSIVYRVRFVQEQRDFTWAAFPVQFLSFVELAIGVIVFCVPTASLFFRRMAERSTGRNAGTITGVTTRRPFISEGSSAANWTRASRKTYKPSRFDDLSSNSAELEQQSSFSTSQHPYSRADDIELGSRKIFKPIGNFGEDRIQHPASRAKLEGYNNVGS